jgi:hypothetical protein
MLLLRAPLKRFTGTRAFRVAAVQGILQGLAEGRIPNALEREQTAKNGDQGLWPVDPAGVGDSRRGLAGNGTNDAIPERNRRMVATGDDRGEQREKGRMQGRRA